MGAVDHTIMSFHVGDQRNPIDENQDKRLCSLGSESVNMLLCGVFDFVIL